MIKWLRFIPWAAEKPPPVNLENVVKALSPERQAEMVRAFKRFNALIHTRLENITDWPK